MSQAFHLAQLQKIDTQLDQIQNRLADIEILLSSNELLDQARVAIQQINVLQKDAQKNLQQTEDAIRKQRIKMETSEASLYGGKIRSPKELQDLQAEIVSIKKAIASMEDEQLEFLFALEQADSQLADAQKRYTQVEADMLGRQSVLQGEKSSLLRDQDRLRTERQAVLSQVLAEDLAIYQKLREQKRGLAISQVEDGACKGCGSSLRPAEIQAARSPTQLVRCSSCGRILYAG